MVIASETRIRRQILPQLAEWLFNNGEWTLTYEGMLLLLNLVSKDRRAPNPYKIQYGKAIEGINNARNRLHQIGVRGSHYKQQAKQAICCALMKLDDDGKLTNKPFINKLLPHKDRGSRDDYIKDCVSNLKAYESKESDTIFNKCENVTRDSYVYTASSLSILSFCGTLARLLLFYIFCQLSLRVT